MQKSSSNRATGILEACGVFLEQIPVLGFAVSAWRRFHEEKRNQEIQERVEAIHQKLEKVEGMQHTLEKVEAMLSGGKAPVYPEGQPPTDSAGQPPVHAATYGLEAHDMAIQEPQAIPEPAKISIFQRLHFAFWGIVGTTLILLPLAFWLITLLNVGDAKEAWDITCQNTFASFASENKPSSSLESYLTQSTAESSENHLVPGIFLCFVLPYWLILICQLRSSKRLFILGLSAAGLAFIMTGILFGLPNWLNLTILRTPGKQIFVLGPLAFLAALFGNLCMKWLKPRT